MKRAIKNIKTHYLFYLILLLSIFLRALRIGSLTTFGVDQGVDFLVIRDMVVNHKWTLIGIKSSVGDFFQGPVALYLMYPFFVLFNLNPIAGAYTALTISIATLILLYITVSKYFSRTVAIFSSLIFAVSPELIMYGNSPLYQHFLPFFIIAVFYLLLKSRKKLLDYFVIGLFVGLGMELHFLNVILLVAVTLYYFLYEFKGVKPLFCYFSGTFAGLLPTILFEVRHNFLNTHLFFEYLGSGSSKFYFQKFLQWGVTGGRFIGGNSPIIAGLVLIVFFLLLLGRKKVTYEMLKLKRLAILLFVVTNIMLIPLNNFFTQYAQGFWLIVIILLPVYLTTYYSKGASYSFLFLLIFVNLFYSASRFSYDHGYNMPDGVTLGKIEMIGTVIERDSKNHPNFNIAETLDGGTRAYQYRYSVLVKGGTPESVTNYPNNNFLYLVSREKFDTKTWEVSSMKPFVVGEKWNFGDGVYLYRLDKNLGG
jgi:hypothetical protein